MSELERWARSQQSLLPSREERTHNKAVANLVRETGSPVSRLTPRRP